MPTDEQIDAAIAADQSRAAGNTAAATPVTPDAAVRALDVQRQGGPPAALGMYQSNGMGVSPGDRPIPNAAVTSFAQDPARAAAVQDDHAGLNAASTAQGKVPYGLTGANSFANDATSPGVAAFNIAKLASAREDALAAGQPLSADDQQHWWGRNLPKPLQAVAAEAAGTVDWLNAPVQAAIGGVLNPTVARAFSYAPDWLLGSVPTADGGLIRKDGKLAQATPEEAAALNAKSGANLTREQRQEGALQGAELALGGLGGEAEAEATLPESRALVPTGTVKPEAAPDGRFPTTPDGTVTNPDGTPMTFNSHRDAADWILKEGNASPDQVFERVNGEAPGTVGVVAKTLDPTPFVPNPGFSPETDATLTGAAERDRESLAQAETAVTESKTAERSPALMEEFLNQAAPSGIVRVDPAAIATAREADPTLFAEHSAEIASAQARGGDAEIPIGTYLAQVSGKPFADELNDAVRVAPDGVSVAEGKELPTAAAAPQAVIPFDHSTLTAGMSPDEVKLVEGVAPGIETAVSRAVKNNYLTPLFTDAKAIGMTEPQFGAYAKRIEAAHNAAKATMFKKLVSQLKRERTPEWKEALAQRQAEVEQELYARPDVTAASYLQYNEAPNGAKLERPPMKIDRAVVARTWGEGFASRLPAAVYSPKGMHPDDAAQTFGYPSGKAMLDGVAALEYARGLSGAKSLKDYVKLMPKARATVDARAETGFDMTPEGLAKSANEALVSPNVEDLLIEELQKLATAAGLPFDKYALQAKASQLFSELPVKHALNIREFERTGAKHGQRAELALLRNKPAEAFGAKQFQVLNQLMLAAVHRFAKEYGSQLRKVKVYQKNATLAGMAQPFLDRIHAALSVIGMKVPRFSDELERALAGGSFSDFAEAQARDGVLIYQTHITPGEAFPGMSVDHFRDVSDMLNSLAAAGRAEQKFFAGVKEEDREAQVDTMVDAATANLKPLGTSSNAVLNQLQLPTGVGDRLTAFEAIGRLARRGDMWLGTMQRWLYEFDGRSNPLGPWYQSFMAGAKQGSIDVSALSARFREPLVKAFQEMIPEELFRTYGTVLEDSPLMDPRTAFATKLRVTREAIPAMLLNMGNDGNFIRLADGYGVSPAEIYSFVMKYVSPEETAWAQLAWDKMNELFPLADANARAMNGVGIHKEEPMPVYTPHGELRGGYWPVDYDYSMKMTKDTAKPSDDEADAMLKNPFHAISTPSGFEQARTGPAGALYLNIDGVLSRKLAEEFTRIAYGQYIRSAVSLLNEPRVANTVRQLRGQEQLAGMKDWLQGLLFNPGATQLQQQAVNTFLRPIRRNLVRTFIPGSVSVIAKQTIGIPALWAEVGAANGVKAQMEVWRMVLNGTADRDLFAKSKALQDRLHNLDPGLKELDVENHGLVANQFGWKKQLAQYNDAMASIIGHVDRFLAAGAAFQAGYNSAIAQGYSEKDAVAYGDWMVTYTQGGGQPKDRSMALRDTNEGVRIATNFMTYPGAYYNMFQTMLSDFAAGRVSKGLRSYWWLLVVGGGVASMLSGTVPAKAWKSPEAFAAWLFANSSFTPASFIPFLRDVSGNAEAAVFHMPQRSGDTPLAQAATAVITLATNLFGPHKSPKDLVKHGAAAAGLLGAPVAGLGQIGKTGQYLSNRAVQAVHGNLTPDNFLQTLQGVTEGPKK